MIDLSYLNGHQRANGIRLGVAFDGQRFGLVAYSVSHPVGWKVVEEDKRTGARSWDYDRVPFIFAACANESTYFGEVVGALHQFGPSMIVLAGNYGSRRPSILQKELRKHLPGFSVKEFYRSGQGRYFELPEIISSVIGDVRSNRIVIAPYFEDRPEREMLRTELASVEPRMASLSPLQEAFIFGLGYWSAIEQRKRYHVGRVPFDVW